MDTGGLEGGLVGQIGKRQGGGGDRGSFHEAQNGHILLRVFEPEGFALAADREGPVAADKGAVCLGFPEDEDRGVALGPFEHVGGRRHIDGVGRSLRLDEKTGRGGVRVEKLEGGIEHLLGRA